MTNSVWKTLSAIDVNGKTEKKNGLTYLSWSWAWAQVKDHYPAAAYEVKKNENGMPYFSDQSGAVCYVSVTIEDTTYEMWLPVMDGANKAMKTEPYEYTVRSGKKTCDAFTMFDVNKTVMRCLVKCLAMFGLGHYIYAGEDLPEAVKEEIAQAEIKERNKPVSNKQKADIDDLIKKTETDVNKFLQFFAGKSGIEINTVADLPANAFEPAKKMLESKIKEAA